MMLSPSFAWKLVLAIALFAAIVASAYAKAPGRALPGADLRRLVIGALALFTAGMVSSLTHHELLAAMVYAAGTGVLALAAWLSRGSDSGGGPPRDEPVDEQPPPDPDGIPPFDWDAFERELGTYLRERQREPAAR